MLTRIVTSILLTASVVRLSEAQQEPPKRVAQSRPVATAASEIPPTTNPSLRGLRDRAEIEAFMDGVMTAQLRDHHVAGATVSIVKDGALFFAKGYGSADVRKQTAVSGASTLFRTSVTGFASRTQAQAFCSQLKAAGKACFVK